MPRVSIVIRTKDRLLFLVRSLLSVQQQSFLDWEIIIVNDGGDAAALDQLLEQVPDVVRDRTGVIHHATSKGRWAAANAGVRAARGDLVVIHDDDDSWHEAFLATMVSALDSQPSSVGGVVCHSQYIDEVVIDGSVTQKGIRPFNAWLQNVTLFRMAARNFIPPISFLYRARMHEELGWYREELPVLGDWDFYMRLLSRFDIQLVPRVLANYHLRPADAGERFGNSVAAGIQSHTAVEAGILNALLRQDLSEGRIGLGTIANLAYDLRELRERASTTAINLDGLIRMARGRTQV
ncbi:glycosyltransferase [Pseudolabrys sp. FHR47]|uniref:glycosyltransferase family 2 protein n=1 Tax=Pseudolabrys sp. FHR47 TaxID=2562284 RepID=UPI00143D8239|nr:glycosyltransferase [Pseudolabrys sp. FHR47]